jgi:hypothetical protein
MINTQPRQQLVDDRDKRGHDVVTFYGYFTSS